MKSITDVIKEIVKIGRREQKKTVFLIGNTIKVEDSDFYLTPTRIYGQVVLSGVIVYSEKVAKKVAMEIDGLIDYIFVDAEKKISDIQYGDSVSVAIGPEGDFSPSEIEELIDFGYTPVTIGKRILRAETAVISALSAIRTLAKEF